MKKFLLLAICVIFATSLCLAQNGHGTNLIWIQSVSSNVVGNNIYRSTASATGPWTQIYQSCPSPCSTSNPIITYLDQSGTVGAQYWYATTSVTANNGVLQESAMDIDPVVFIYPPQPPTGLTAQPK